MARNLYTIICEYDGGTFVRQEVATNEVEAVAKWFLSMQERSEIPIPTEEWDAFEREFREDGLSAIEGTSNVWCFTGHLSSGYALANVVATRPVQISAPQRGRRTRVE